jgi:hypothetical protein
MVDAYEQMFGEKSRKSDHHSNRLKGAILK